MYEIIAIYGAILWLGRLFFLCHIEQWHKILSQNIWELSPHVSTVMFSNVYCCVIIDCSGSTFTISTIEN